MGENSFQDDRSSAGRAGRVRAEDAGSPRAGSTWATEDEGSRRPARSDDTAFRSETGSSGLPFARPGKIVCVGLNYRDHAKESGMELPVRPLLFAKWASSLIGPGQPIVLPEQAKEVDYEAELGVLIGTRARRVSAADALGHVAGYVCANEVSARDIQFADGQWTRGKSFDTFGPVGPITPAEEVPNPQVLGIRCLLNGDVVQDSSTAQMVFTVAEVIAFISDGITLEPGDLILTGTPPGVGLGRKPPVYLADGDEVTIEIDGLGSLTNPVQRA